MSKTKQSYPLFKNKNKIRSKSIHPSFVLNSKVKYFVDIWLSSSDNSKNILSFFVQNLEGWHGLNSIFCSCISVDVNVDLGNGDSSFISFLMNIWSDGSARSAPSGVKVYDNDRAGLAVCEQFGESIAIFFWHYSKYL